MHRRFSHDLYVVAKTDPMKFDHDPRYLSKLVSGAAEGKFASAPQQLCSAVNQGVPSGTSLAGLISGPVNRATSATRSFESRSLLAGPCGLRAPARYLAEASEPSHEGASPHLQGDLQGGLFA
jgi:hypothetical protein